MATRWYRDHNAMDLSAGLVETISTSTMLLTTTGVSPEPDDTNQSGGLMITIAAGVCGGFIGILVLINHLVHLCSVHNKSKLRWTE